MKSLWRSCAAALLGVILATNAAPFAALAASTTTQKAPPPVCSMTVNPPTIAPGGSVTLTWSSQGATGGSITGVGPVGTQGSINLLPSIQQQSTTFVGTFTGLGGTAQCQATVQIVYGTPTVSSGTPLPQNGTPAAGGGSVTSGGTVSGGDATVPTAPSAQSSGQTYQAPAVQSSNGGLVPCGTGNPGDYQAATSCQACNLAQLIQNVINFIIGLSIPIAAALFAYAGVLYITYSSNPGNKEKAKKIFKSAFIGFIISITAWLVIDTLLHILFTGTATGNSGSWFTIQCSKDETRNRGNSISDWLKGSLPGVITTPPVSTTGSFTDNFNAAYSQFTPSCGGDGYQLTHDESGNQACYNTDTGDYQAPVYGSSGATTNAQMSQEIAAACSQYGMDSTACSLASAIAGNESSGGRNCSTSPTGAAGCMQVLATTACSLDSSIDGCDGCIASRNSTSAACQPVIAAVSGNTQLGTSLGVAYINQQYNTFGSCQAAAAAYYAGPGAVQKAGGNVSAIPTPSYPGAISPAAYAAKACGGL